MTLVVLLVLAGTSGLLIGILLGVHLHRRQRRCADEAEHQASARAAQNPSEKAAHYAAARVHEQAARDPALAAAAAEYSAQARAETKLRQHFSMILREATGARGPTRRGRG